MLIERGCAEEAVDLLRDRADDASLEWFENRRSASRLAELLVRFDRVAELEARADGNDHEARLAWNSRLEEQGAFAALARRAEVGDVNAGVRVAHALRSAGNLESAISVARDLAASDKPMFRECCSDTSKRPGG